MGEGMKIRKKKVRKFIEAVLEHLFDDGDPVPATRLVLERDPVKLIGSGWCRDAVRGVIERELKEARS